jgi:hypothetical protein
MDLYIYCVFFFTLCFSFFLCVAQITKLPTLDSDTATSPNIIQESEADTILKASEFVLGLSSYIGM